MKSYVVCQKDLVENINKIKQKAGNSRVIAVLKGQGYGLGIIEFAKVLLSCGIDFFAVSEIDEALTLRNAGFDNDILLLSSTSLESELCVIAEKGIIASVGSVLSAKKLSDISEKKGIKSRCHIKVDTGFGRFGFLPDSFSGSLDEIKDLAGISIEGIFSHFSFSFSNKRKDLDLQFNRFLNCIDIIKNKQIPQMSENFMAHMCNSCAFVKYDDMHLDAVRVGSAFLGRLPVDSGLNLNKIGMLKSCVTEIKTLPKGYFVGYANTYKTKKDTKIAIIPVGYKDGFGVLKSNDTFRFNDILRYVYNDVFSFGKKLYVKINGKNVRIIGRISMYNIVVDITGTDIKIGDEVYLEANPILVSKDIKREYI